MHGLDPLPYSQWPLRANSIRHANTRARPSCKCLVVSEAQRSIPIISKHVHFFLSAVRTPGKNRVVSLLIHSHERQGRTRLGARTCVPLAGRYRYFHQHADQASRRQRHYVCGRDRGRCCCVVRGINWWAFEKPN